MRSRSIQLNRAERPVYFQIPTRLALKHLVGRRRHLQCTVLIRTESPRRIPHSFPKRLKKLNARLHANTNKSTGTAYLPGSSHGRSEGTVATPPGRLGEDRPHPGPRRAEGLTPPPALVSSVPKPPRRRSHDSATFPVAINTDNPCDAAE